VSSSAMVARAVVWNVVTGVGARIVGLIGTLVLARFIAPDEYGLVSVAAICVSTAGQFSNLQLGQYLIVQGNREQGVAFHAAVFQLALGLAALGGVWWLRDSLGPVFGAPGMGRFIPGFVLAAAIERVGQTPEKLLARDLRFRLIALTRGAGELCYTALALSFAPSIGGMAIVVGNVGRAALVATVFVASSDRQWLRPVRLSWTKSVAMFNYSSPLALARLTDFAAGRWDNLVISGFHGAGIAGTYNLAYNLSQTSTGTLADQVLDVLFPSFASLEPKDRGRALVRALSSMSLLVMPLTFGLAAVATTLVTALFPPRWGQIAPMLVVLSVSAALLPLASTLLAFWRAQRRTGVVMIASAVRLALLLGALVTIGPLGPLWACAAVDLSALGYLLLIWWTLRPDHRPIMWPAARGMLQPMLACLPMLAFVQGVQAIEPRLGPVVAPWALGLEIAAGAAGYAAGAFLFARDTAADVTGLGRQLILGKLSPGIWR